VLIPLAFARPVFTKSLLDSFQKRAKRLNVAASIAGGLRRGGNVAERCLERERLVRADAYYRKRREAGDSHAEALRRIERRIARCVFGRLRADHANRSATSAMVGSVRTPTHVETA